MADDKERQQANKNEESGDSQPGPSTSSATGSSGTKLTLADYLDENAGEGFALYPRYDCPHLATLTPATLPKAFNTKSPCESCDASDEIWICLACYGNYCGRYINGHMSTHHTEAGHGLALSFADLSAWCFECDSYVDHPDLYAYKNLAHLDKFGEEMVWSYAMPMLHLK